jgi:hypothetical protein
LQPIFRANLGNPSKVLFVSRYGESPCVIVLVVSNFLIRGKIAARYSEEFKQQAIQKLLNRGQGVTLEDIGGRRTFNAPP